MPYHVYTRSGAGAVGVIVETAKDALAKAAEFLEGGHPEVIFKDLLGNILDGLGRKRRNECLADLAASASHRRSLGSEAVARAAAWFTFARLRRSSGASSTTVRWSSAGIVKNKLRINT